MTDKQKAICDLAQEIGAEVYDGYSGRSMFGAECLGIDCDNADDVIERCREYGLPRPSVDSLGKGYICYWPGIPAITNQP